MGLCEVMGGLILRLRREGGREREQHGKIGMSRKEEKVNTEEWYSLGMVGLSMGRSASRSVAWALCSVCCALSVTRGWSGNLESIL